MHMSDYKWLEYPLSPINQLEIMRRRLLLHLLQHLLRDHLRLPGGHAIAIN